MAPGGVGLGLGTGTGLRKMLFWKKMNAFSFGVFLFHFSYYIFTKT